MEKEISEEIELLVKVLITYPNIERRGEGIQQALDCATSMRISGGYVGCKPISAELMIDDKQSEIVKCICCGSEKTYRTDAIHCARCATTFEV